MLSRHLQWRTDYPAALHMVEVRHICVYYWEFTADARRVQLL
jgi:hypothetical protein